MEEIYHHTTATQVLYDVVLSYQDPFEANNMTKPSAVQPADELIGKLRALIVDLENGASVALHGSPISGTAGACADLFSLLAQQLEGHRGWGLLPNPGLCFVEKTAVPNDDLMNQYTPEGSLRAFGNFYDPVGTYSIKEGKRIYSSQEQFYHFEGDPLGNPLQVEIAFHDPTESISLTDRRRIAEMLHNFSDFLFKIQFGLIDWRFMRHLEEYLQAAKPKPKIDTSKTRYSYEQRRKSGKKGKPRKKKNH
jgi:hypothetical protein